MGKENYSVLINCQGRQHIYDIEVPENENIIKYIEEELKKKIINLSSPLKYKILTLKKITCEGCIYN